MSQTDVSAYRHVREAICGLCKENTLLLTVDDESLGVGIEA